MENYRIFINTDCGKLLSTIVLETIALYIYKDKIPINIKEKTFMDTNTCKLLDKDIIIKIQKYLVNSLEYRLYYKQKASPIITNLHYRWFDTKNEHEQRLMIRDFIDDDTENLYRLHAVIAINESNMMDTVSMLMSYIFSLHNDDELTISYILKHRPDIRAIVTSYDEYDNLYIYKYGNTLSSLTGLNIWELVPNKIHIS